MEIEAAGEKLQLFAERAIYWKKEKILFISDTHFGKSSSFRALGVNVPEGGLSSDLNKISFLLKHTKAEKIFFLGDFYHSKMGKTQNVQDRVIAWRNEWPDIEIKLIRGNHDLHAGDPCEELNIKCYDEPYNLSPFVLTHSPKKSKDGFVLCGHVHPGITLYGKGVPSVRVLCFYFTENYAVLPAFGDFTGAFKIKPDEKDSVYIIAENEVIKLNKKIYLSDKF